MVKTGVPIEPYVWVTCVIPASVDTLVIECATSLVQLTYGLTKIANFLKLLLRSAKNSLKKISKSDVQICTVAY
jgi:hypothetical protein